MDCIKKELVKTLLFFKSFLKQKYFFSFSFCFKTNEVKKRFNKKDGTLD